MHQYLRAIGFNDIQTKKAERELLGDVEGFYSCNQVVTLSNEDYAEYKKDYGEHIGVIICGEYDTEDRFQHEYHFPYMLSQTISSYADIIVDKRKDSESYMGICEDVRIGVSLIFYIQNPVEYMIAMQTGQLSKKGSSVSLAGLALSGTVLFPIKKTPVMIQNSKEESRNRMMLVSAAKKGDSSAMESLTMDDMDTYTQISRRIHQKEDVFSIVDTYFMPYGIECDEYSILGEIIQLNQIENTQTKVLLYHMVLEINEMHMEVCVPVDGVMGEPEVGRRFKAVVWLQGKINFPM